MTTDQPDKRPLLVKALLRLVGAAIFLPALLLVPAGTVAYWEAWVYLAVLFLSTIGLFWFLYVNDPALLERRMQQRERHAEQRVIVVLGSICYRSSFNSPASTIASAGPTRM